MRNSIVATTLAVSLAVAALQSRDALADHSNVRVVVSADDLIFEKGIPYYRVSREPVYVTYMNTTPTYYRVVSKTTFKGKAAPPPWAPAYGWRMKEDRLAYGHYDEKGDWHWH